MHRIDNTSISVFKECPKKWHYGMQKGLRPLGTAAPLVFGGAWHTCLEHFDIQLSKGLTRDEALISSIRQAFIESSTPEFLQGTHEDSSRSRETLVRGLVWYEENYRNEVAGDMNTFILPNGKPAIELTFAFELPHEFLNPETGLYEPCIYTGHIDKIVTYQGRLFPMERKHTTSSLYDHYWNRYINSAQIDGYIMACKVNWNLEDVGGGIIDATQFGATFSRFGRRVVNRTPERTNQWLLETLYWLTQMDNSIKSNYFPRNTESCNKYSGCQFYQICFASPALAESLERDHYRVEKWDPTKIRGEEA